MSVTPPDMRPPRVTPNLGLPVPGDASPADPPTDIGNLADALDALAAAGFVAWQTGELKISAGSTAPSGWLVCNGQLISRTVYSALWGVIGTTYGAGDGVSTFAVPNLVGRMPLGSGGARPLGAVGGVEVVRLSPGQSGVNGNGSTAVDWPDHSHYSPPQGTGGDEPSHDHGVGGWRNNLAAGQQPGDVIGEPAFVHRTTGRSNYHSHTTTGGQTWGASDRHSHGLNARGADEDHTNMPPWIALTVLIKT